MSTNSMVWPAAHAATSVAAHEAAEAARAEAPSTAVAEILRETATADRAPIGWVMRRTRTSPLGARFVAR